MATKMTSSSWFVSYYYTTCDGFSSGVGNAEVEKEPSCWKDIQSLEAALTEHIRGLGATDPKVKVISWQPLTREE